MTFDLGMFQAVLGVTISYRPPAGSAPKVIGKVVTVGKEEEDEGNIPFSKCMQGKYQLPTFYSKAEMLFENIAEFDNVMKGNKYNMALFIIEAFIHKKC